MNQVIIISSATYNSNQNSIKHNLPSTALKYIYMTSKSNRLMAINKTYLYLVYF